MKTDIEIKNDVLDELAWQPNVDENEIGVVVENGTVMLTGVLDNYRKKVAAEEAVKRVKGVKALAGDIQVRYGTSFQKTDVEIAKAIVKAFEWNTAVPEDKVSIEVRDGWVNLSGEVDSAFQKDAAARVVKNITGLKWVNNVITIKQAILPVDVKEQIAKAFKRSADIEADGITVEVHEDVVKLKGKVHSLTEKKAAQKTAYFSPGVYRIENELEVVD
ncbi:BON domain-containing protein [Bizionia gelidisalsuginis]|uniref:BON domain-containing protein n=1 Tax=Bizionia gelidisalsuginis TaxID=291188 RepID=A0ABY3M8J8_9FLAO|nr:BON domain-containing protein [Bizionia gelidisalsuginis]TYC10568.1 BON domain-containing protein [Bizionia gelidisalsuginis]